MVVKAPRRKLLTLTDAAAEQVKAILVRRDHPAVGLRISVKNAGCSGMSYDLNYAEAVSPHDEVIEDKGVTIVVDAKATMYLIGAEIDYVTDKLRSGFEFRNPNEKGRCGCGESFHV
jgi:iron-sulfur cluster assembly protein